MLSSTLASRWFSPHAQCILGYCPVVLGSHTSRCVYSFFIDDLWIEKGSHVGRKPSLYWLSHLTHQSPNVMMASAFYRDSSWCACVPTPEQRGCAMYTKISLTCSSSVTWDSLPATLIFQQDSSFPMLEKRTNSSEESCPEIGGG